MIPFVEKRIFTKKNKALFRARKELKTSFISLKAQKQHNEVVSSARSILAFRNAQSRYTHLTYSKSFSALQNSVVLKRSVRGFLNSFEMQTKLARSILKSRLHRAGY